MNYQKIYDQLIEKRRQNPLKRVGDGTIECHHIKPVSFGGSNDETNLINLTTREHYVAHLLLLEITKQLHDYQLIGKMLSAIIIMQSKCLKFNSHLYEQLRTNYKGNWFGRHHKIETRNKIRKTMTSKKSTNPRIWICKNDVVKYVLKSKLQSFIDDGYELGRKGYKPRANAQGKKI